MKLSNSRVTIVFAFMTDQTEITLVLALVLYALGPVHAMLVSFCILHLLFVHKDHDNC